MTDENKPYQPRTGGSYVIENGVERRVVGPPKSHPLGDRARNPDGTAADPVAAAAEAERESPPAAKPAKLPKKE